MRQPRGGGCRFYGIQVDGSGSGSLYSILAVEAFTGLLALAGLLAAQSTEHGG
ncbi:MAG: hypothetical protein R3F56_16615 [Planctomycetota bacterium]